MPVAYADRHHWSVEENVYLEGEMDKLLSDDRTTVLEASDLIKDDFNKKFNTTFLAARLLGQYYSVKGKKKDRHPAPDVEADMFIVRIPSSDGRGWTFRYPKDIHALQDCISELTTQYGRVPPGVHVYKRVEVEFQVSLKLKGEAEVNVG